MSDADRAAKAARAKAMLKKRQREKAGGTPTTTSNSDIASPNTVSRTASPAPQEEHRRDIGDVFSKDNSDTSWLSSLPRAPSPQRVSPHVSAQLPLTPVTSQPTPECPTLDEQGLPSRQHVLQSDNGSGSEQVKRLHDSELKLQRENALLESRQEQLNEQINVLQSETASLSAQVERLRQAELRAQQLEASFEKQLNRTKQLEDELQQSEADRERVIQTERQTISLLVSEKSTLTAEVERLEDAESKANTLEGVLEEERHHIKSLSEQVQQLQVERQNATQVIQSLQIKEKDLSERYREKEREIHLTASLVVDARQEAEQYKRRVRELEEQIQSDDRVDRLENSLKNTQNRADELEFHLSKMKQAHSTLKVERDDIESQRQLHSNAVLELKAELAGLQKTHAEMLEKIAMVTSEKDSLTREKSDATAEVVSMQKAFSELQEKLVGAAATIASDSRQLQTLQNQLKASIRRADDAERTQRDLQAEGTNLMRSLDEMRPKIVELTGTKLELMETTNTLEHELQNHRDLVSHLDSNLKLTTRKKEELQQRLTELIEQHEKERALSVSDSSEIQKAYFALQKELNEASVRVADLETGRASHVQEAARRIQETERLASMLKANAEELSSLHEELDTTQNARDEARDFLQRAQNEVEGLRADLIVREDEITHLREAAASSMPTNGGQSLDDELVSSLRQQHALEISAAQSQIRALEHNIFDANARVHALQKQVGSLENQLSRPRPSSRLGQRSFSPIPSGLRPASRNSELRRSSFGSHRPASTNGPLPPLARSIYDQNMSAETRHKRLVSLSMLKARIDSEVEVATSRPSSRASSVRALSPVRSIAESHADSLHSLSNSRAGHVVHRPQFLDDSHVFWCHSCSGDLVIL